MLPSRIRSLVGALVVGACMIFALPGPSDAQTSDPSVDVVAFEGLGLGHGAGLPLDGAHHLASEESAPADQILDRFYPATDLGNGDGLVRFLVATRDDARSGFDVRLPEGGVIRDGRTTPVAPSFPIRVPSERTVRLTVEDGFYRAEVLDDRSVSGTHEITDASPSGTGPDAAPGEADTEASPGTGPSTTTSTVPGLGASPNPLWIDPREGGAIVVGRTERNDEIRTGGLHEVVLEAERFHLVGEADVETYLSGLSFVLDDETGLEPAALEAAVIAARTYALRAAASEPRVGRFHLFADERSFPFVGVGNGSSDHLAAVEATAGRVLRHDGTLAAALVTVGAGGATASAEEVFTDLDGSPPYLRSVEYETAREFRWRAEMTLTDVADRLGYEGEPESVAVNGRGPSGRATALVVHGDAGALEVTASEFNPALRLPSSHFQVAVEERPEGVSSREASPPFQELPGTPVDGTEIGVGVPVDADGGGVDLPPLYVLGPLAALASAVLLTGMSRLVRWRSRRRGARRTRRRTRRWTRSRTPAVSEPATSAPAPAPAPGGEPEPDPEPGSEPEPEVVESPEPTGTARARPGFEGPTWHNEPEWLADLTRDDDAPDLEVEDVDEHTLRRSIERMRQAAEKERERPLRELLGWEDAPDWVDEEPDDAGGDPNSEP